MEGTTKKARGRITSDNWSHSGYICLVWLCTFAFARINSINLQNVTFWG
jgi:hypothetical protein